MKLKQGVLLGLVIGLIFGLSYAFLAPNDDFGDRFVGEEARLQTAEINNIQNQFGRDLPCGVIDFDSPQVKPVQCDPSKMQKGVPVKVKLIGSVMDESGKGISYVKVKVNSGEYSYSDKNGEFEMQIEVDSVKKAINIVAEKFGYSPIRKVLYAEVLNKKGTAMEIPKIFRDEIVMREIEVVEVNLDEDIVITSEKHPGLSASIPAGSLVNSKGEIVTGEITGEITYLDPNDPNDVALVPGFDDGDGKQMVGIDSQGEQVLIESSGMVFFHFKEKGSSEILQPKEGVLITITQPMPDEDYRRMTDPEIVAAAALTEEDLEYFEGLGIVEGVSNDEMYDILIENNVMALHYWHFNQRTGLWEAWAVRGFDTDIENKRYIMKVPSFY